MNDRELLALAARAAGLTIEWHGENTYIETAPNNLEIWAPLRDPGDALRLAVALYLTVEIDVEENEVRVFSTKYDSMNSPSAVEYIGNDPLAATMRGIVRAAAEIGRTKT